ncbi:nuclear transport factor 2 family protein [Falsibacillus pallidus]|uniref:nuclear transport factor 2 family protein n=1 Tax=Falsibacillus pallidus TaxID=493781 RepID=UPI003D99974C
MNNPGFREFLDAYLKAWKNSSITEMKNYISPDYQAREISGGDIIDFGYEESIEGWKQGFEFVLKEKAAWDIAERTIIPLREDECLAILSANIIIEGKPLDSVNLFFNTFRNTDGEWKLVRSYIEAGVSADAAMQAIK